MWISSWSIVALKTVYSITKKTISRVRVSPCSAETLIRRGGIANHRSIAYYLSNNSAKNYQNRLTCAEVKMCIAQNQCHFFETHCSVYTDQCLVFVIIIFFLKISINCFSECQFCLVESFNCADATFLKDSNFTCVECRYCVGLLCRLY